MRDTAAVDGVGAGPGAVWAGVDRLIDRAPGLRDLLAHRLELLAARRWRVLGWPVPGELVGLERAAAARTLAAPLLLQKVRVAYEGPIILLKGLEAASAYPDPVLRPFVDVDLLVPDAEEAQHALLAGGFRPVGDYPEMYSLDVHHLRPLWWPGLPLHVEVHRRPNWPEWLDPPRAEELLAATVPSTTGIEGVLALDQGRHALVLAAHAWGRSPLGLLRDLVDVAALVEGLDRRDLDRLARGWGLERVWRTTLAAVDAVLFDASPPSAVRLWARHLPAVRDRTVLENHVQRWLSPFWALPAWRAARAGAAVVADELRPAYGETRAAKVSRARLALRNAFRRESDHAQALGNEASKLRDRWSRRPRRR